MSLEPENYEAFYYKALSLLKMNKFKEAEENAKQSINLHPQKIETYIILAKSYVGMVEKEKALICFDRSDNVE